MIMKNSKQIVFSLNEFGYFSASYQRSREINQFRLKVKRKLAALGKLLLPTLQDAGLDVKIRTSLHHPYIHNRFSVQSLWAYFSAPALARPDLVQRLGKELSEDLQLHYNNTLLLLGIEQERLLISLKIHPAAWWDGQNIKNKCKQHHQALLKLINDLDGFYLKLDNWPNLHDCRLLTTADLQRYFSLLRSWRTLVASRLLSRQESAVGNQRALH